LAFEDGFGGILLRHHCLMDVAPVSAMALGDGGVHFGIAGAGGKDTFR